MRLAMVGAREGRSVDALAPGGDEGCGTLRKAAGRCERSLIRGCPNGETPPFGETARRIHRRAGRTPGTGKYQYPEEKKKTENPGDREGGGEGKRVNIGGRRLH